jgi:hypothetical protein
MIDGGWKAYYGIKNKGKSTDLWIWDEKKLLFDTFVVLFGCEVCGCNISRESCRKI